MDRDEEHFEGRVIPTSQGPMSAEGIVDFLTYANYRHNRQVSPHITPKEWAVIYPGADKLEARYQSEIAIEKASAA